MDTLVETIRNYFNLCYTSPITDPKNKKKTASRIPSTKGLRLECGQAHLDQTGWDVFFFWNLVRVLEHPRTLGGKPKKNPSLGFTTSSWPKKRLLFFLGCIFWIGWKSYPNGDSNGIGIVCRNPLPIRLGFVLLDLFKVIWPHWPLSNSAICRGFKAFIWSHQMVVL